MSQTKQHFKDKQKRMEYSRNTSYNLPQYKNISLPFQSVVDISFSNPNENIQMEQTLTPIKEVHREIKQKLHKMKQNSSS